MSARLLVYTSPARGHLFPIMPTLLELRKRGHAVAVRTLASEVEKVRAQGFEAGPISAAVERREMDDWRGGSPLEALRLAVAAFIDRAKDEVEDLRAAIRETKPSALFIDVNSL